MTTVVWTTNLNIYIWQALYLFDQPTELKLKWSNKRKIMYSKIYNQTTAGASISSSNHEIDGWFISIRWLFLLLFSTPDIFCAELSFTTFLRSVGASESDMYVNYLRQPIDVWIINTSILNEMRNCTINEWAKFVG